MSVVEVTRKKKEVTHKDIIQEHLRDIIYDCTCMSEDKVLGEHVVDISSKCTGGSGTDIKYKLTLNIEKIEED